LDLDVMKLVVVEVDVSDAQQAEIPAVDQEEVSVVVADEIELAAEDAHALVSLHQVEDLEADLAQGLMSVLSQKILVLGGLEGFGDVFPQQCKHFVKLCATALQLKGEVKGNEVAALLVARLDRADLLPDGVDLANAHQPVELRKVEYLALEVSTREGHVHEGQLGLRKLNLLLHLLEELVCVLLQQVDLCNATVLLQLLLLDLQPRLIEEPPLNKEAVQV